ncbi:MAG TPA: hypothetical protein VJK73_00740 [Candidatus Paceibacterota bacterium]
MTTNTTPNPSNIERVVMRRVRTIRLVRPIFSMGALAFVIFILALWGIGREVWVARVFENAPGSLALLPGFYFAAFENTRLAVQLLTLATVGSLIYLARATAGLVSSVLTPARA